MIRNVLTFILAGGKGERLYPLTRDRAKPAVPFGGIYRIIDFTLSNCINSGLRKIYILVQYKSYSLMRHISRGWNFFDKEIGEFIEIIPAQMRISNEWYQGTADAIYQNIYFIERENPDLVLILAGDHIYKTDYSKMINYHIEKKTSVTVASFPSSVEKASEFGIIEVDKNNKIISFYEKPDEEFIKTIPKFYISMGIYLFNKDFLEEVLGESKKNIDFGRNVIPSIVNKKGNIYAYPFIDENKKDVLYWRDIGTIEAYYETSMDLVSIDPIFNLYDKRWPIRTYFEPHPPAKTVHVDESEKRIGIALNSIISPGSIISGGRVERSIISPNVKVHSWTDIQDSIIMEGCEIGRRSKIRKAIIDKFSYISPDTTIGYNGEEDRKRFFVTEGGVVVIPRNTKI